MNEMKRPAKNKIIDVRNLTKIFRIRQKAANTSRDPSPAPFRRLKRSRFRSFNAVDHVSLQVEEAEILGVLGPNGAGKTTLIKLLCGLLVPDRGGGTVLGFDILSSADRVRSHVSLVAPTADIGTDNNLTVRENLEFWASVYGIPRRDKGRRIDALLDLVELKDVQSYWPMGISAGMRQRLAIARSLLAENPLVFLDEPTVKLDPDGARRIRDFIRRINRENGTTILLTTHLMYEAEELCSRIIILDGGRIVAEGSPAELKRLVEKERILELFASGLTEELGDMVRSLPSVREADMNIWDGSIGQGRILVKTEDLDRTTSGLLSLMQESGIRVDGIRSGEPNLEDVFFTLTGKGLVS